MQPLLVSFNFATKRAKTPTNFNIFPKLKMSSLAITVLTIFKLVKGDITLHVPRGSNNKLFGTIRFNSRTGKQRQQ
jgi:hypothetical protein